MRAVALGHVCADLERVVLRAPVGRDGVPLPFEWPDPAEWIDALRGAGFVHEIVTEGGVPQATPLVLSGSRLYLTRYFRYEQELALRLIRRTESRVDDLDRDKLDAAIHRLFPDFQTTEERQARAARAAVESRLAIIAGGPGTGKTTAVARIMALLIEFHPPAEPAPRIALLAPTGKAAQRLAESITGAIDRGMPVDDDTLALIPREAATIHRALGVSSFEATTFRHNEDNPLNVDVVLVDEASMIDLALMAKLVAAVPPDARLIFLGDRDQLASVEAGAIFGDICLAGADPTARIAESTVELTHRFRFAASSPIGALSEAIKNGDGAATLEALPTRRAPPSSAPELPPEPDLFIAPEALEERAPVVERVAPAERGSPVASVSEEIVAGYRALLEANAPEECLQRLSDFRVLCAHRRGRFGVEQVGEAIESLLVDRGLIPRSSRFGYTTDLWYPGRPVLVLQNDYALELFNGDVGITLASPTEPDQLRVWFTDPERGVRSVQPARLPPHETCFAMTVHKSQGSEFGGVVVVLPSQPSPIGTRELLYTAVTRARMDVTVVASDEVIEDAVGRGIVRASGLRETLAGV
jgi:exodeoxyribonuclease V alpha subunit